MTFLRNIAVGVIAALLLPACNTRSPEPPQEQKVADAEQPPIGEQEAPDFKPPVVVEQKSAAPDKSIVLGRQFGKVENGTAFDKGSVELTGYKTLIVPED